MSDMLPGLFEDETATVPLEQVVFDYRLLSTEKREFVLQKTDETQILLKRTAEHIIQIGKNLHVVKERLPHGMFLPWLRSEFGMSQVTANNFMHVAERFDGKLKTVFNLPAKALYLLASPSTPQDAIDEAIERAESGEKITHALAKQIIEEQEARNKAEQSSTQACADLVIVQQLLVKAEEEASSRINTLNEQMAALQQQMAEMAVPPIEYRDKEVWPEEKQKELAALQARVDALNRALEAEKSATPPETQVLVTSLQERNKQLAAVIKAKEEQVSKLKEDIDTAVINQELKERDDHLRAQWRLITSEVHSCMMRLLGQLPTPLDLRSFEGEDWDRVAQLKETLRRVLHECDHLQASPVSTGPYVLRSLRSEAEV